MKKIATKFSAIALIALALTSCKKTPAEAPVQDKEFQSAIDASAAVMTVTDLDMMAAQASEYAYMTFYSTFGAVNNNTCTLYRDTMNNLNTITFNNAIGADGKVRNGRVYIDYTKCSTGTVTSGGQQYIRNPNHMSKITFWGYSVGKFRIKDSSSLVIINTTPAGYSRSVTPLSWSISGSLYMADTTDNNGSHELNISWNGSLNKTLVNSTSNTVHPSPNLPIVWTTTNNAVNPNAINAIVRYSGTVTGVTTASASTTKMDYTFKTETDNPLYRYFGCSPDYYINKQQHPISKGKVKFATKDKDGKELSERILFFGDQDDNSYCDNSGILYINGVSYNVDFIK